MESQPHVEQQSKFKVPRMFAVVLHNDDVTTMDFVVDMLVKVFSKNTAEASSIMIQVHQTGKGIAGFYSYDIAVSKKMQADRMAAEKGFPLQLTVE